jgi:hypothetical protein
MKDGKDSKAAELRQISCHSPLNFILYFFLLHLQHKEGISHKLATKSARLPLHLPFQAKFY